MYRKEPAMAVDVPIKSNTVYQKNQANSNSGRKIPTWFYVYGWYKQGETLPFYVGKGVGRRAKAQHQDGYLPMEPPERVEIYRDRLTAEGALLVESVLIDVFRGLGARLKNVNDGLRRREVLPLEMKEMIEKFTPICPTCGQTINTKGTSDEDAS